MGSEPSWRIDDLAQRAGVTVDTIRFYQREGLLPPAERAGRNKLYGPVHLERLERIRELQQRRFSLAACRALLETRQAGIAEGIFGGTMAASYTFDDLVDRSGIDPTLARRLHEVGLVREPAEFGRDAYDGADLDVMRAAADLIAAGLPADIVVEVARIYTEGVEQMQSQVLDVFLGRRGIDWDPEELTAFQARAAAAAGDLLPLVGRMVAYVHQRTLQHLTLGAMEQGARDTGSPG
jgi:DNA-binding transcriptional MerR regulator